MFLALIPAVIFYLEEKSVPLGLIEVKQKSKIGNDRVSRFHTRQAFLILIVFVMLLAAFFVLLVEKYNISQRYEKEMLSRRFEERVSYLDNLLAIVTSSIDGMRMVAENDLTLSRSGEASEKSIVFKSLKESDDRTRYHLDTFSSPLTRDMIGNLTGLGSFRNRDRDYYRDINMALNLNTLFCSASKAIKNAAWIYYTSKNNFLNIYPWVSSTDFKFSTELYTHEFYTLGLPENNPYKKRFWTKVYVDEYGKGLMTTCAAPVYDRDRFMGTVAIDLTVDFLNTVIKNFSPQPGTMFLVNQKGQVLAHPTLITSDDREPRSLKEALPAVLRKHSGRLPLLPDREISRINSFNILKAGMHQAPWQVVYIEPASSFWVSLQHSIGIGPVIVLAMMLVMVTVVFAVTRRQFILPSEMFVNYIMARSKRGPTQADRKIPRVWKPWFAAVEGVFSENDRLAQALQGQNDRLELRVKQRTAQLEKEIEDRKRAQETLRESEEKFRTITASAKDAIIMIDTGGCISYWNEAAEDIFGFVSGEIMGKNLCKLISSEHYCRAFGEDSSEFRKTGKGLAIGRTVELTALRSDGEEFPVEISASSVNLKGEWHAIGIVRDISRRKQLEEKLRQAQKMEALGLLAGGVAHDLNNILTGILSYPDLLLMQIPEDSAFRGPLQAIKEAGKRAAAIVHDLVTLARRGVPVKEVVNLNDIISEYLTSPEYEKLKSYHPDIEVETCLDPELRNIMGSPVHLSKTVMNLVLNAAEAMADGGKLLISTANNLNTGNAMHREGNEESECVILEVSDTGIGISPEDQKRIFEPFYTKKKMGRSGTGLGLAVVWGTVKDHNGDCEVHSNQGEGTTFRLFFPLTRQERAGQVSISSPEFYMGRGEHILVVDDVKEQREIVYEILSRLGYSVATASSGEEAVEYVKANSVDLLILDMVMEPGMDGLDTYRRIVEVRNGMRAVIASGFSGDGRIKKTQELGAGAYVKKPYTMEKIGLAVRKELDR